MSDTNTITPQPGQRISAPIEALFHPERGQQFIIEALLRGINTAKLVQVVGVHPESEFAGTVDVQPMVLDADTNGLRIEATTIYGLPYQRLQGGVSAVILDPVVDDIGLAVFCDRATQGAIAMRAPALPDNSRTHAEMDGFYFGGFLNSTPMQWVKFLANAGGIDISTPGALTLEGQTITLTSGGATTINAPGGFIVNANTTFNGSVSGTSTGAGSVSFAAPVTAPDFIAPNAKLNTHQHAVSGSTTVGNPHN